MAVVDIRQRTGWLFLAVIAAHIILISAQVNTARGVPLLEAVAFGVFAEVQRGATAIVSGIERAWTGYVALQDVRAENDRLRREIADLRLRLQGERADASRARLLEELLGLRRGLPFETTGATVTGTALIESAVIGAGASPNFRAISIDKGTRDGLRPDLAVIAPAGVVGRVVTPSLRAAKVQLLIDGGAGAGALVERSRAQGVVEGTGQGLRLTHLPGTADIQVGDVVVTSGIEGFYPKGLLIGQIESIERLAGEFSHVAVRPAVDFASLEAVLVVLTPPPAEPEPGTRAGVGR